MQQTNRKIFRAIFGAAMCTLVIQTGWAQGIAPGASAQAGDPARWYQEDATPRARAATSTKEAGAAYREAQIECRKDGPAARSACLREARSIFRQDLADARQQAETPRP